MKLHANARTCPKSRRLLVKRVLEEGWSLAAAAPGARGSPRTARHWGSRFQAEGDAGLLDRSSRPKRSPQRIPASRVKAIEALRRLRMTAAEIAECLGMALSTVSRWLRRIGLVSLAPGYETVDWGGMTHVGGGSHGALNAEDSLVPLLTVGLEPGAGAEHGRWRISDVAELVLAHFAAT
jgi:transposase